MHVVTRRIILYICILFLSACGVKTFQLIEPPSSSNNPNISNGSVIDSPELRNSVTFIARNISGFSNSGTEVFYRIYTSQEDLQNDAKSINSANKEYSENGYKKLISLGYKEITSKSTGVNPLIDENGGNVTIFLSTTDSESANVSGINEVPLRYNRLPFNFDSSKTDSKVPSSNDSDFNFNSDSTSHYFVNLYAVSTGSDIASGNFGTHSELLSLGFLYYEAK